MRGPERCALGLGLALGLAACAVDRLDLAPPAPDRPWRPQTDDEGGIVADAPALPAARGPYRLPASSALAGLPAPVADPAHPWTLAELIDRAERTNPATRIAWQDARRVALAAGIAESAFLPQLTATVLGGYRYGNGQGSIDGLGIDERSTAHGTVSALTLRWLLFDFGQRAAAVDAAQQAVVIANIAFTAAHQQVIHAVSSAYYAHAAARDRERAAQQGLDCARQVEAAAQARYRQGLGTVVELAEARQATAAAVLAQIEARGRTQDARLALLAAVGESPLSPLQIAGLPDRPLPPAQDQRLDALVAAALAERPDVQAAQAAQRAAEAKLRAARAESLPKVFLSATGSYGDGSLAVTALPGAGQEPPTVNVGTRRYGGGLYLGISVPLFDGGVRSALVAQAQAEVERSGAAFEQVRDTAARQVVAADNALRTALAAHAAALVLQQAAQTRFAAALDAYRAGLGTLTAVTLAQQQWLGAGTARSDARSAALGAAATLALASGALGEAPLP